MILPSITVEPNQISFIFYFYFSFCNWGILKVWSRNLALSNPWPSPSDFHFLPSVQTWDWSFQCCPSVYLLKLLWLLYKSITLIFELFECALTGHFPQFLLEICTHGILVTPNSAFETKSSVNCLPAECWDLSWPFQISVGCLTKHHLCPGR